MTLKTDDLSRGNDPVLALSDVSVRFGGVTALAAVSFTVEARTIAGIVGPNGAGKSTLLNAICGLAHDNMAGSIRLNGQDASNLPPISISRRGVGRSFQDPPLLDTETVLENLLLGAHAQLHYSAADQVFRRRRVRTLESAALSRARELLASMNLAAYEETTAGILPYGTRKLIDIGRAMMSEPELLLLDEPTSGLDTNEQNAVATLLRTLHERTEMTMVLVEHHIDVVRSLATQVIGLESGSVVANGPPEEVFASQSFRATLVGGRVDAEASHIEESTPGTQLS